jgi:hypothetical protein
MTRLTHFLIALVLSIGTVAPAQAGGTITDQRYYGGKYGSASTAARGSALLVNCPREYREMYRGDLYCRKPEYQLLTYRHPACPKDVWGMYRGDLYCLGRR